MRHSRRFVLATSLTALAMAWGTSPATPETAGRVGAPSLTSTATDRCISGAHTLSPPGSVMYPETGNGGYTSLHTGVFLRYDAPTNRLLTGTHVTLTLRADQCLSDFSLDLERRAPGDPASGPDLQVDAVSVEGLPARSEFVQPTYPGDPKGQDDPDPRAHQVSQDNPVGGPDDNPLPPACSPSPTSQSLAARHSQDGDPCPANKLVIHPVDPIPQGARFTVQVTYHGRPGVHHDGDGVPEGWFRTAGGSSMTTEPMGSEDWMPLNNFPTAKPSYDFHNTTNLGTTAIANGRLIGVVKHQGDAQFPAGSATWSWHAPMPIASYLALSLFGDYSLSSRVGDDGTTYYLAQDRHLSPERRRANRRVMETHEDITAFEAHFNGAFPFASDGVVAGIPGPSGDTEEMESMIVFTGGKVNPGTLYHETMHQWWGDNVSESGYTTTFFKEGLAMLSQFLRQARVAEHAQGGPASATSGVAFDHSLATRFNRIYGRSKQFWIRAPSNPAPYTLFNGPPTYLRPGATYVALRAILGGQRFIDALQHIQAAYGGSSITEARLEAEFRTFLPVRTHACDARLDKFFSEWFDTGYPPGGGANRPMITGPGLDGPGFYLGACHR